jgi:hypothetical protein
LLSFLGTGPSDYLDVVAAKGWERAVGEAVFAHLDEHNDRWRRCHLEELPAGSVLPALAQRRPGWRARVGDGSACPGLFLPPTGGLESALPARMYQRLCYERRRAERETRVEVLRAGAGELDRVLDQLFALHRKRWSARGEQGVLGAPAVQRFHRRVASAFAQRGELALHRLDLDGEPAAVLYGFRHRRVFYYYLGGFEPAVARLSPGRLVIGHAIEEAIREGCVRFDFLRGEESYKERWGARPGRNRRLHIERVESGTPVMASSR